MTKIELLDEIEKRYTEKSADLYKAYTNDKDNVPKPTFESSVALVIAICEGLKGELWADTQG